VNLANANDLRNSFVSNSSHVMSYSYLFTRHLHGKLSVSNSIQSSFLWFIEESRRQTVLKINTTISMVFLSVQIFHTTIPNCWVHFIAFYKLQIESFCKLCIPDQISFQFELKLTVSAFISLGIESAFVFNSIYSLSCV
jgi:hypothetical protein